MTVKIGDILIGRYQIETLLGEGGMGAVYKAVDTFPRQPVTVALKEFRLGLLPSEDETQLHAEDDLTQLKKSPGARSTFTRQKAGQQFKQEAQILHDFDHPNLPKVKDYFAIGEDRFLVMELIEGLDLEKKLLQEDSPSPLEKDVLGMAHQILEALSYCHARHIIHRDVKPANVIADEKGRVVLVDFGIARIFEENAQTIVRGRTSYFSPPEQYSRRGQIDERSDIYSFGATMYNLLTGQPPEDAMERALGGTLVKPSDLNANISTKTEEIILKCLEMDQAKRFQNVGQVLAALDGHAPTRSQPKTEIRKAAGTATKTNVDNTVRIDISARPTTYGELEAALTDAEQDTTIILGEGVYRLDNPLSISKQVHLQGKGIDKTVLSSKWGQFLLSFNCEEKIQLQGITFFLERSGVASNVVEMKAHEVEVRECKFTGGVYDSSEESGGCGLWLNDVVSGIVTQCVFDKNDRIGLVAAGRTNVVIEKNMLEHNSTGILLIDRSEGAIRHNVCRNNSRHGIQVCGFASPAITDNECSSNNHCGITFYDNATGTCEQNTCRLNSAYGIQVCGNANPRLLQNHCQANKESGISVFQEGTCLCEKNKCEGNSSFGIEMFDSAAPILRSNICIGNKRSGIGFFEDSTGVAEKNRCTQNQEYGIFISDRATLRLKDNDLTGNGKGEFMDLTGTNEPV